MCNVDAGGRGLTAGLVSIGLPVYNGAAFIERALDSLVAQTYSQVEIIISDNASEDGSLAIARRYAERHPHIRIYQNERNLGPHANFRIVLEKARGEFFMWAGCDDEWDPDFAAALVEALRSHADAVVAQSGFRRLTYAGADLGTVIYPDVYARGGLGLALRAAASNDLAIFFCGLFRTAFLQRSFKTFRSFRDSDRLYVAELALSRRLVSVPRVLYTRGVRADPAALREMKAHYAAFMEDRFDRRRSLTPAVKMLLQSKIIPRSRMPFVPLILATYKLGQHKRDFKRSPMRRARDLAGRLGLFNTGGEP